MSSDITTVLSSPKMSATIWLFTEHISMLYCSNYLYVVRWKSHS